MEVDTASVDLKPRKPCGPLTWQGGPVVVERADRAQRSSAWSEAGLHRLYRAAALPGAVAAAAGGVAAGGAAGADGGRGGGSCSGRWSFGRWSGGRWGLERLGS